MGFIVVFNVLAFNIDKIIFGLHPCDSLRRCMCFRVFLEEMVVFLGRYACALNENACVL
jgi:hypothetical protein